MIKPLFITFEGCEGCGKTTQSKLLANYLTKQNITCVTTREPGGTNSGETIRDLLLKGSADAWQKNTEVLLHMAARSEHITQVIKPALSAQKTVICDRFIDSTVAYQGYGHKLGADYVMTLHNLTFDSLMPDITFILDVDLDISFKRIKQRSEADRYEQMELDFHTRVKQGFRMIAKQQPERCFLIDGTNSVEAVNLQIIDFIEQKLKTI